MTSPGPRTGRKALREAVQHLLGVCEAREGTYPFGVAVCIGLLERSRKLTRALLALEASRLGDTGEGIVRSILENCATAGWLGKDPEGRASLLLGAYKRDIRILEEEGFPPGDLTNEERDWLGKQIEQKLPKMPQRAKAAGIYAAYSHYRVLSMQVHGTLLSAASGLRGGPVSERLPLAYLSVAGATLAKHGQIASELGDWGIEDQLREAMEAVNLATPDG